MEYLSVNGICNFLKEMGNFKNWSKLWNSYEQNNNINCWIKLITGNGNPSTRQNSKGGNER